MSSGIKIVARCGDEESTKEIKCLLHAI